MTNYVTVKITTESDFDFKKNFISSNEMLNTVVNKNSIEFDTISSHFEAIMALSEKYPDTIFTISYSSDDMGYKEYSIYDGIIDEHLSESELIKAAVLSGFFSPTSEN